MNRSIIYNRFQSHGYTQFRLVASFSLLLIIIFTFLVENNALHEQDSIEIAENPEKETKETKLLILAMPIINSNNHNSIMRLPQKDEQEYPKEIVLEMCTPPPKLK